MFFRGHEELRDQGRTANRLSLALGQARCYVRQSSASGSSHPSFADELGSRFSSSSAFGSKRKKTKVQVWKVIPVSLQNPRESSVPKRGVLGRLCRMGLGSKWFTADETLEIEAYLSADEVHFLIVCLYPQLKRIPYEFCKAAGPGNSVVVALNISDDRRKPRRGRTFHPFFSANQLKQMVGRKGKLYLRPLEAIPSSTCPFLSEIEVSY